MPDLLARHPTPLDIGLLTHSVNPRGGVVHTLELADALHRRGHRVTVFAPASAGQTMFRASRCEFQSVPVRRRAASVVEMVATRRQAFFDHLAPLLGARRFDVLHAQDAIGGNALADLASAGAIGGFVRTVHHLDRFDDPQLMIWQRRAFARASQVLCVSRTWCDRLQADHGVRTTLVNNGVNLARYTRARDESDARVTRRYGLRIGACLVLAVGGVEERKNTQRMLEAFILLRRTRPTAQLVVVGGASLLDHDDYARGFAATLFSSGLRYRFEGGVGPSGGTVDAGNGNLVRNHAVEDDVVITGPVPDIDMPALFRAADVLAMASMREGFGLVVLEALASGTPVVVSRRAPFTEYLAPDEDVDHACWAEPGSAASIARAFERACDPRHRRALAEKTPEVCARFTWESTAVSHEAIYRAHRALAA